MMLHLSPELTDRERGSERISQLLQRRTRTQKKRNNPHVSFYFLFFFGTCDLQGAEGVVERRSGGEGEGGAQDGVVVGEGRAGGGSWKEIRFRDRGLHNNGRLPLVYGFARASRYSSRGVFLSPGPFPRAIRE